MREDLGAILPELIVAGALFALIVLDIALKGRRSRARALLGVAIAGLAAAGACLGALAGPPGAHFSGMLAADGFGLFAKGIVYLAALLGALLGALSPEIRREQIGEYLIMLLCAAVGMSFLVSAQNLLMLYLALELVSLPSYILAGFRHGDRRSSEAALKYVIFGAASSGFMLYGFSLLYGLSGTLELPGMLRALTDRAMAGGASEAFTLAAAMLLALVGFGYKVAAVPFHMWCPDVYEGAPTPITTFLSIGPKAAGIAALTRFVVAGFMPSGSEGTGGFPWPIVVGLVSIATMTVGNLAAFPQTNIKRLLAYSSIAHAGYMLMAVAVGSLLGLKAVLLYLAIYLLMNAGAFVAVMVVRDRTGSETLDAYRGLGARSPLLAVTLAIFLFSLVGIPPFAGFIGKFFLFAAVLQAKSAFFTALAVIGVLNSVLSLYYYARVVKAAFFEKAETGEVAVAAPEAALLLVLAIPVLLLGVWWGPLAALVERSTQILR